MTCTTAPYTPERHVIGGLTDGRPLVLVPMTPEAAAVLAPEIAMFGPWAHYNIPAAALREGFARTGDGAIRYQLLAGDTAAGVVVIRSPWLAGPYLQMLAVLPALQGRAIGSAVLDWYEAAAAGAQLRSVWLCVSEFNADAQRLYRRHGYAMAGVLPDMMRDGDDELLMRKSLVGRLKSSGG